MLSFDQFISEVSLALIDRYIEGAHADKIRREVRRDIDHFGGRRPDERNKEMIIRRRAGISLAVAKKYGTARKFAT